MMGQNNHISQEVSIFHGRATPELGTIVGYGAIIEAYKLPVPFPARLALISKKHRQYSTEDWLVYTPRHQPDEDLYAHLVFALKYEGVNLLVFKKLFEKLAPTEIVAWIINEPQSQYSRRIWFLYEWLMQMLLGVADLKEGNYVTLIDEDLQYASPVSTNSNRHRVRNNLAGNVNFCPLISKPCRGKNMTIEKSWNPIRNPYLNTLTGKKTANNNMEVLNNTLDYYRYFDATKQAEFLFECVDYTISRIIPEEVKYLRNFDSMKTWLDERFQMPDNKVAQLIRFLNQNGGKFSKRAKEKEFTIFTNDEIAEIEEHYQLYFE